MCELPIVGHCKKDDIDVYIGRRRVDGELKHMNNTAVGEPGWLGNPYPVDECGSLKASINKFAADFEARLNSDPAFRTAVSELNGETLGCWCKQADDAQVCEHNPGGFDAECHGDVIRATVARLAVYRR